MNTPEELERQRREAVYVLNGENIEKLKAGQFSWEDYKKSFEQAKGFGIIEEEEPDEILELEKDDILRIGKGRSQKTGIEKSVWRYIGPETKPEEKKAPERFLFDGLKSALFKSAYSFEAKGRKREMADYIFGEVQDKVGKGELDWKAFGDVLRRTKEYGGILKEIPKEEYEKILKDQGKQREGIRNEIKLLIEQEKKLADKGKINELKEIIGKEEGVKEKFETLLHSVRYITKWEKGEPKEETFYTFAGTPRERKRGSLESLVYDEISGPILDAAFEASRRKKEEKREKIKWQEEAERERKKQETHLVEAAFSSDLGRLSRLYKKKPEKAIKKAEKIIDKVSVFIGAKILITLEDYKKLTEKEEILPGDINSRNPSLVVGKPEEEKRILEIKFGQGDVELVPPFSGDVHFKRPIRKENLVLK